MTRTDRNTLAALAADRIANRAAFAALASAVIDAQAADLVACARLDVFHAEIEAEYPKPADDVDDDTFDAWNDAHETAYCDRGGYDLESDRARAADALLVAVRAYLRAVAGTGVVEGGAAALEYSFAAALHENTEIAYPARLTARRRCLDLARRLAV